MKVSVNLPADDVSFLDEYVRGRKLGSRSAALHSAVDALRLTELADAYADAWEQWSAQQDAADWDATLADGM
jgi:Arc/MetJ-type ribon-helix-helix transcriptional regulator